MDGENSLIVIGGATASGKTALAVEFALHIGGEVVSCDSMQIYRRMDIGTAKPTSAEMRGVPHHLIGVLEPEEPCSAARYRELALPILRDIAARGRTPILCGGTGLYIDALTRPLGFSSQGGGAVRAALEAEAAKPGGAEALHRRLAAIDPERASHLHVNDVRRVVRALEIYETTGRTPTEQMRADRERAGDYRGKLFVLDWPREALYQRINRRVDQMMADGLLGETYALRASGVSGDTTAMQAIGYRELSRHIDGELSLDEAVELIKRHTRQYAKRQLTWFRRDERVVHMPAQGRAIGDISREMEGYIT